MKMRNDVKVSLRVIYYKENIKNFTNCQKH